MRKKKVQARVSKICAHMSAFGQCSLRFGLQNWLAIGEQHFQILDDHGVNLAPPAVKNIGNEGRDGVRKALAKGEG
jgi:hypothetical protein